jgi:enolase
MSRFGGKGVLKAVGNVNEKITPVVLGMDPRDQKALDDALIKLDGTEKKTNLGANAILGVSMAACRAGAAAKHVPLYKHINDIAGNPKMCLPVPAFNVINGGRHAGNMLAMQEFMILPIGAPDFVTALRMGAEVYMRLKGIIKNTYGMDSTGVGDEGGFAPNILDNKEGLRLLERAITEAGYAGKVKIGMDVAASEFFDEKAGTYNLAFKSKNPPPGSKITGDQLLAMYEEFCREFPFVLIEDGFDQDDWESYRKFMEKLGGKYQLVGDDLLVTNVTRIGMALEKKACNALLLKLNQIGTLTEAIGAWKMAREAGWGVMVSHRSGETEDSFIADLTVGLGTGELKTGAPCRSERLAKYNQLVRIEEELGKDAVFAGEKFRTPWLL